MTRHDVYSTCDVQLAGGKKFVAVQLLSQETIFVAADAKCKVNELVDEVANYLGLNESVELFGLCICNFNGSTNDSQTPSASNCNADGTNLFLDPSVKLNKYAPKSWKTRNGLDVKGKPLLTVHFKVQFYVDSYLFISDRVARNHYYLQMKSNVISYNFTSLSEERAFLLASYALQIDLGNFNTDSHTGNYFNAHDYFPDWIIERVGNDYINRHMPSMHQDHKGMSKHEAQALFIKEASESTASPHNLHLYKLHKSLASSPSQSSHTLPLSSSCKIRNKCQGSNVWIAICPNGVEIYEEDKDLAATVSLQSSIKKRLSVFYWADIGKLFFERKKFEIRSVGSPARKFTYFSCSEELTRHLLWLSRVNHQFQLMIQPKMKEVKKREQDLSRKKYRESYIYSSNDSKFPFELPLNIVSRNKKRRDEMEKNNDNAVVLTDHYLNNDFSYKSNCSTNNERVSPNRICRNNSSSCDSTDQRVSVISNASSNTTSGIISDKVQSLEGDSDADDLADEMDQLAKIASSPPPNLSSSTIQVSIASYSLESLALSEPTETKSISEQQLNNQINDLQELRQKSQELSTDLPLITALFNDRSLMIPKTVPTCSRERHMCNIRYQRRFSCSYDSDMNRKMSSPPYITNMGTKDIPDSKEPNTVPTCPLSSSSFKVPVSLTVRPTSWHVESFDTLISNHLWEQQPLGLPLNYMQTIPQPKFQTNSTADYIEKLWAEHQLNN